MKKKAELLKAINAKRQVVMNFLKDGKLEEAQKESAELEKMTKEFDEMPDEKAGGKVVNVMNEKERLMGLCSPSAV